MMRGFTSQRFLYNKWISLRISKSNFDLVIILENDIRYFLSFLINAMSVYKLEGWYNKYHRMGRLEHRRGIILMLKSKISA